MEFAGFVGPSYTLPSIMTGIQRSVNLYLEVNEAEETRALICTPGLTLLSTPDPVGPSRGLFTASNERAFQVSGSTLYEITDPSHPIGRGGLVTATGTVSMADNGVHLLCVDGTKGYTFKFSDNTFAQIADVDFPVASYAAFIDQYVIVNSVNTGNFYLSGLSDVINWDALDFAAAEGYPDKVVRLMADRRELILIGSQTIELWFDTGDAAFPFSRDQGGSLDQGSLSPDSWVKVDGGWCGIVRDANGNGIVARLSGVTLQRLSTFAVENALKSGTLASATAWAYQDRGHTFYCLNAPGLTSTWCLDVATGQWHERQSAGARNRVENHCVVNGVHVAGDYQNGKLYKIDPTVFMEEGVAMTWTRRAPHIEKETKLISISELVINMETGNISNSYSPNVSLITSRNGGSTFGNPRTKSANSNRVRWQRLGESRDWVIQASGSFPATITGAFMNPVASRN
jgi:hypothetical protein